MNKCTISEAFGEQLTTVTAGTQYEVDSESDNFISELEHRIRRTMYSLWMDAQSEKLANHLEKKQAAHFEQLYEFSYGIPLYDQDQTTSKNVESLALRIIDEKYRYLKQIEHLRERYERFKRICDLMNVEDKQMIVSYFEKSQKVDYETLRKVMRRYLKSIESIYKAEESKADQEADKEEEEYQATLGKQRYRVNNRNVYMTPTEYLEYQAIEKAKQQKLYERLGLSI